MRKSLIVGLMFLLVAGCAETPEEFAWATEVCKPFGGLKTHYIWPTDEAWCNNGLKIQGRKSS